MAGGEMKRRSGVISLVLVALLLAAPLANAQSTAKKRLVCWKDDAGNRACGDAVPARYATKEKRILDQNGRTVRTVPGALTESQRLEQDALAQQAAIAKSGADRQAAYDRALTSTYATPQDLAELRDDRLSTIDTRIEISEAAARRDAVTLAELRSRLPSTDPKAKPDLALTRNIGQFEVALSENQRAVADLRRSRDEVCTTFARDIERFQELKLGSSRFQSPCPPLGSFAQAAEKLDLASARSFFDQWADLQRDFDPALLDLYADNAVVKTAQTSADGEVKNVELPIAEYRKLALVALPLAKANADSSTYSNVKVVENQGRAKVSGTRTSSLKKSSAPFHVMLKPAGKGWRIVEEWSETQP